MSRNLSFAEKTMVSSEVTETDVIMEEMTSHNKNSESVEYTVQISVRNIVIPMFNAIFHTINTWT